MSRILITAWMMIIASGSTVLFAATFTSRPSEEEAIRLLEISTKTSLSIDERTTFTTSSEWPSWRKVRAGSIRDVVGRMKTDIIWLSHEYIDQSLAQGGSFENWFDRFPFSELPRYSQTSFISHAGVPVDVESWTPSGVISNLGPASATHGLKACAAMIRKLSWLPQISIAQSNVLRQIQVSTNYSWRRENVNIGQFTGSDCQSTNHIQVYESGQLDVSGCGFPIDAPVKMIRTTGAAYWRINGSSSYSGSLEQYGYDYFCASCIGVRQWNLTRIENKSGHREMLKEDVKSSSVYCNTKPSVRGQIDVYATLSHSVREQKTGRTSTQFNCNQVGEFSYVLPEWKPDWPATPKLVGSGNVIENARMAKVVITPPIEVVLPEASFLTHQEHDSCDSRSGPHGFGVFCYGKTGVFSSRESCSMVIPPAVASLDAKHALIKLMPRHTP